MWLLAEYNMQMTANPILKKIGVQSSLINHSFKYSVVIFDFINVV